MVSVNSNRLMAISLCLSVVRAFPQRQERGFSNSAYYQPTQVSQIPILSMDVKNDGEAYQFAFETGNKIAQQEAGDGVRTQGSYAYVAPDGQQVSMSYVADAEGFRPQGSHMPVAPPMPEAIRKAVEQNLADEARGIVDDGQYHENPKTLPAPALPPNALQVELDQERVDSVQEVLAVLQPLEVPQGHLEVLQVLRQAPLPSVGPRLEELEVTVEEELAELVALVHTVEVFSSPTPKCGGRAGAGSEIPIIRYENVNNGDGTYQYLYETGNGINAQEQGDGRGDGTQAQGSFSYTAPDGQQIQIQYTADANGFNPQGAHIPTPPPIPPEIQRSIEQNLADEARGIVDDGAYKPGPDEGGAGGYSGGGYSGGAGGSFPGAGGAGGVGGSFGAGDNIKNLLIKVPYNTIMLQAKLLLSEADKLQQEHSDHRAVLEVSDHKEELEGWDPGKLLAVPDTDIKFRRSDF
ncbi:hypothetical protein HUJ04_008850 [Dendroctonus ponderosae]|nr:hypothetical protein HUJ04_008850 [Dendroctonus ponderosae]